ncbi:YceI family protein [Aquihabitans sp. McL0605]|uniref:YceI family protein n=1 Tax=Aquihabitans sp. McL0605 TaxID=3415671 RepID=UPI003CFAF079
MTTNSTAPTTTLPLQPGTWALDPAHSAVSFTIRHLGVSKVRGRFGAFTADVVIGETLATTSVTAVIQVASVSTGHPDRDAHVLADDMVDVALRPTLTFRSTSISGSGDDWEVVGDLTIGEVTNPVTLAVELGGIQEFPGGPRHAGFEATTQIRRQDFGLMPAIPGAMLGDVIKIELDLQLLEP